MGKETKIGLAVIISLFVILGAVVTVRIASSARSAGSDVKADASDADAVEAADSTAAASVVVAEGSAPAASRDTSAAAPAATKPTVLSASPDPTAGRGAQWRQLAAQNGQAEATSESGAGSAPSNVPMPPSPVPDEPGKPAPLPPEPSAGFAMAGTEQDGRQASGARYGSRFDAPEAGMPVRRHRYSDPDAASGPELSPNYMPRQDTVSAADIQATGRGRPGSESDPGAGRRADGTYEVQPNDNFWTISKKLYGTGAYFRALAEHNRGKIANQNQLQVGQIVAAPDVAELEQKYAAYCPKPEHRHVARHQTVSVRTAQMGAGAYTVVEGDSLYRIARHELGDASRWYEVYKLNREVIGESFNHLRPGTQLVLPEKAGAEPADVLTRRPGPLY